jgi:hypothetical protein
MFTAEQYYAFDATNDLEKQLLRSRRNVVTYDLFELCSTMALPPTAIRMETVLETGATQLPPVCAKTGFHLSWSF